MLSIPRARVPRRAKRRDAQPDAHPGTRPEQSLGTRHHSIDRFFRGLIEPKEQTRRQRVATVHGSNRDEFELVAPCSGVTGAHTCLGDPYGFGVHPIRSPEVQFGTGKFVTKSIETRRERKKSSTPQTGHAQKAVPCAAAERDEERADHDARER